MKYASDVRNCYDLCEPHFYSEKHITKKPQKAKLQISLDVTNYWIKTYLTLSNIYTTQKMYLVLWSRNVLRLFLACENVYSGNYRELFDPYFREEKIISTSSSSPRLVGWTLLNFDLTDFG